MSEHEAVHRRRRREPGGIRQLPWRRLVNPYRPVEILSEEQVETIHRASLRILAEIGMQVLGDRALDAFAGAGAMVDRGARNVRLEPGLAEALVAQAPREFRLHARNPERDVVFGGANLVFCAVGGPAFVSDLDRGRRPGNIADFTDYVRLIGAVDVIHQRIGAPPPTDRACAVGRPSRVRGLAAAGRIVRDAPPIDCRPGHPAPLDVRRSADIVILVGNTFRSAGFDVRPVGALLGAAFGFVVIVAGLVFAEGRARADTLLLGAVILVLAASLGWLFARRAIRPGAGPAFRTSIGVTLVAVPLGALISGMAMAVGPGNLTAGEAIAAGVGLAFVGLLFLGLPLAGLTLIVASLWVGMLRMICRGLLETRDVAGSEAPRSRG